MTVAEDALKTHSATRMWYLLIGGILCVLMIVFGYFLTQRQMEIIAPKTMTEVELNVKKDIYKFKSTYPGLVLIICGTILGGIIIRKKFYFKTQHKDEKQGLPGYTELES